MLGQVNQQRHASAAASQPRQPQLPSCGRRGPAIAPPSLPRNSLPCIDDCVSTTISDSVKICTLWIKFKIYPPQVSIHHRVTLLINNTADVHHFHRRLTVTLLLTGSYKILGMRSWNHTTFYTCMRFPLIPMSQPQFNVQFRIWRCHHSTTNSSLISIDPISHMKPFTFNFLS